MSLKLVLEKYVSLSYNYAIRRNMRNEVGSNQSCLTALFSTINPIVVKGGANVKDKYLRFGDFIKNKRINHPDELTLKEVSKMLGISLSFLSDVENNRRKPFDKDKIDLFAELLGLDEGDKAVMFDLAARDRKEVPSDIEDIMMYGEIGEMARLALRKSNAGEISEEDWKRFIRETERKKDGDGY